MPFTTGEADAAIPDLIRSWTIESFTLSHSCNLSGCGGPAERLVPQKTLMPGLKSAPTIEVYIASTLCGIGPYQPTPPQFFLILPGGDGVRKNVSEREIAVSFDSSSSATSKWTLPFCIAASALRVVDETRLGTRTPRYRSRSSASRVTAASLACASASARLALSAEVAAVPASFVTTASSWSLSALNSLVFERSWLLMDANRELARVSPRIPNKTTIVAKMSNQNLQRGDLAGGRTIP